MANPRVSIIIPTSAHLEDCMLPCLDSILKYTNLEDKEIIVVSNSSDPSDRTLGVLGGYFFNVPSFQLLPYKQQLGYTRATNIGILNSTGEYIVFLNNDTVLLDQPKDQWIDMLINPLKDTNIGVTGPLSLTDNGTGFPFIVFFCAATTRDVINRVGVLNETFSPGGCEDIDFCIRAQKENYNIATVPHNNLTQGNQQFIGGFPIWHKGEVTVHEKREAYSNNFRKNELKLIEMYGQR